MKKTQDPGLGDRGFRIASLAPHAFWIDLHKCTQLRIKPGNFGQMSLGQFHWR